MPSATPPAAPPAAEPVCANLWSRLFMRRVFEDQWVLPVDDRHTAAIHRFFRWYEKHAMRIRSDGIALDRPVFILSLPRSGSSMLQDLLCALPAAAYITNMMHLFPDCFCAAEFFRRRLKLEVRGERFLQDSVEVGGGSPSDPVGLWSAWLKQDPFSLATRPCALADFSAAEIAAIRDAVRRVVWCFGPGPHRFVCKTPALLPHVRVLHGLFPDARFIHLVRDARQNANSMLKLHRLCNEQWQRIHARRAVAPRQPVFVPYPRLPRLPELVRQFGADDLRTTAHLWNDAMALMEAVRADLPAPQFHEVRYEDICARPQEEMARLLRFIDLPAPDASAAVYHQRLAQVGRVHHRNDYGNFDVVAEICGPALRRYGYL